jgi:hypothetical protein
MTSPERCSCRAREKNKCSKESEHKTGKMCLKDEDKTLQEFINSQESLGVEFEQVLTDNLTNLYGE